ncbi:protein of unknown function [Bradyrhizobium vignae]|uniref:Uncharacterized protein n=1 Tax=Bradyrhizobium vignae TaxID=1549949 RepID=A0A2U3PXN2_9BRAD|nr:protein of unknown function [Bradyrhizobium vignae]
MLFHLDVGELSAKRLDLLASRELCRRVGGAAREKVITFHDLSAGDAKCEHNRTNAAGRIDRLFRECRSALVSGA